MSWPDSPLDLRVRAFILGQWVDFGPVVSIVDDYYTDVYTDVYLGRLVVDARRLPSQDIDHTFGRSDEASGADPSQVTVTLWNEDGYLTPDDPRSPFWAVDGSGWGRGTRFEVWIGTTGCAFSGEVSEIEQSWEQGDLSDPSLSDGELLDLGSVDEVRLGFSSVKVTASGVLRRVSQGRPPLESALRRAITRSVNLPHVAEHWPMEDGSDAVALASSLPGHRPLRFSGGALSPGSDSSLVSSKPLPSLSQGQSASWMAPASSEVDLSGGVVVETVVKVPQAPDALGELLRPIDLRTTGGVQVVVDLAWDSLPLVRVIQYDGGTEVTREIEYSPDDLYGDTWVLLRLEVEPSLDFVLLWSPITTGVDPIYALSGSGSGTFGVPSSYGGLVVDCPEGGFSIGHTVAHDGIANGWLAPADSAYVGEVALGRIRRMCTAESVDLAWTKRDATGDASGGFVGESTAMGPQRPDQLVSILQACADADAGILCEQRGTFGLLARTRRSLYNQDPAITLDASESGIANPFAPVFDDQQIRNRVKVTRTDGASAVKVDPVLSQPPPVGVGLYEESYDLDLFSDMGLDHHAGWRLHFGVYAGIRYPQVTIDLAIRPDLIEAWLALRPGDVVRVTGLPPQERNARTYLDLMFQGASERIGPFSWTATLNCSPYAPWVVGRWVESRWSLRSELASGVDADDTALSVAFDDTTYSFAGTTYTPRWTTTSEPVDLLIGGCEHVTATAISGSSSPQSFTVTRNVNGLARAHTAGAEVRLLEPAILGL